MQVDDAVITLERHYFCTACGLEHQEKCYTSPFPISPIPISLCFDCYNVCHARFSSLENQGSLVVNDQYADKISFGGTPKSGDVVLLYEQFETMAIADENLSSSSAIASSTVASSAAASSSCSSSSSSSSSSTSSVPQHQNLKQYSEFERDDDDDDEDDESGVKDDVDKNDTFKDAADIGFMESIIQQQQMEEENHYGLIPVPDKEETSDYPSFIHQDSPFVPTRTLPTFVPHESSNQPISSTVVPPEMSPRQTSKDVTNDLKRKSISELQKIAKKGGINITNCIEKSDMVDSIQNSGRK